jgi:ribonuclease P protein subunit POP4
MDRQILVKKELIGRTVTITHCTDPAWINKTGTIIDETKNTFLIRVKGQPKRIAKDIARFEFRVDGKKIVIDGTRLTYRPEDRIKKAR